MKAIRLVQLAVFLLAFIAGKGTLFGWEPTPGEISYIAHRGEAFDAPEGTRPAYELAMERHLTGMKLDLRYSRDKVIVLSHDPSLKRTTGSDLTVAETDYADLNAAVFKEVGGYRNERILTFDEVLEIVHDAPFLFIDFKFYSEEIERDAFDRLQEAGIPFDRVITPSFSEKTLAGIKRDFPEVRTVLHISLNAKNGKYSVFKKWYADKKEAAQAIIAKKEELGLFGVNIQAVPEFADREFIAALQNAGLWVSIWFVNKPDKAVFYADAGADAFVTDCGGEMREAVESNRASR